MRGGIAVLHGASRTVILTRRHAFKLPSLRSWRGMLWGPLSNLRERERSGSPDLCPVRFSLPLGLLVVMPRCAPVPLDLIPDPRAMPADDPDAWKADSFGLLNGRVVRVDYHGAVEPKSVVR